jgi:hypothetical protein
MIIFSFITVTNKFTKTARPHQGQLKLLQIAATVCLLA